MKWIRRRPLNWRRIRRCEKNALYASRLRTRRRALQRLTHLKTTRRPTQMQVVV